MVLVTKPCTTSYNAQAWLTSGTSLAVDDAASNLEYGVAPHTAMKLLFRRENFADLAGYLSRAYKRRFSALNGVEAMKAVAAGRDPVDDVAALSQASDAEEDG